MANEAKYKMSQERLTEIREELFYLETVREKEVSEQIKEARSFGDLSENSEYDEAKNEQSRIEANIVEMEYTLRNCIVIDDDDVSTDSIGVAQLAKWAGVRA